MSPLLKNLLGNGWKDREQTDELRAVLRQVQEERGRLEALLRAAGDPAAMRRSISGPI